MPPIEGEFSDKLGTVPFNCPDGRSIRGRTTGEHRFTVTANGKDGGIIKFFGEPPIRVVHTNRLGEEIYMVHSLRSPVTVNVGRRESISINGEGFELTARHKER